MDPESEISGSLKNLKPEKLGLSAEFKLKIEKYVNDSLSIEHKVEIQVMGLLISIIINSNN